MRRAWIHVCVTLGVSAGALACAGPRMVAPTDVSATSRTLEVQNRSNATGSLVNEDFILGEWKVRNVDRDWGRKSSKGIGGYQASMTQNGYSYELTANTQWQGACSAVKSEQGAFGFSWGKSQLVCECNAGASKVVARLAGKDASKHTQGEVKLGERALKLSIVEATDKANYTGTPAGYRADDAEQAFGAVETLKPGRVWLNQSLSAEDAEGLSCAFAGLMLYVPPSDF